MQKECRYDKATMPRKMKESDKTIYSIKPLWRNITCGHIMFVSIRLKKRLYAYLISVDDYSNYA